MSMLELITKAVADGAAKRQAEYPIILNPDDSFSNLTPEVENPDPSLLAAPVSGWQFSSTDSQLIDLSKKFSTKLKRKLKDTNNFAKDEFVGILNPFLEKVMEVVGSSVRIDSSNERYTKATLEKVGGLIGSDAAGLVLDACLRVEMWDLLETMIANKFVAFSCYSSLVASLVAKKRSDLLCLCIKYAPDLGLPELLSVLRYFLCLSKEAKSSMANVKKEWETNLTMATRILTEETVSKKKLQVAREACFLLMIACDGFTMPELCLHYLFASQNIDEVVFSTAVGKLNGQEMLKLIKYLGKWLKKYETFPLAIPCPKASSTLGLKACDWIPKLEDVIRSFGLILDENFSSLVLHSEFHEQLKSMQTLVASMSSEAQVCCSVANVVENLRNAAQDEQNYVNSCSNV